MRPPRPPVGPASSPRRRRRPLVLLTLGVLVLLASLIAAPTAVELWWGGRQTGAAQDRLLRELASSAPRPVERASQGTRPHATARRTEDVLATPTAEGHPLAVMRIPALGASWRWAVVEGTAPEDLALGPGHYAGTPLFGAAGNVGVAGHRAGHGSPFIDLDRLMPGDRITVTQAGAHWTYEVVQAARIVDVQDTWVLAARPGRTLTLTTCWPRFGSSRRMYLVARQILASSDQAQGASA